MHAEHMPGHVHEADTEPESEEQEVEIEDHEVAAIPRSHDRDQNEKAQHHAQGLIHPRRERAWKEYYKRYKNRLLRLLDRGQI